MGRFLKRIFIFCLCLALFTVVFNAETDYMKNFKGYCPSLSERFPEAADFIEGLSKSISEKTNYLTIEKLIAKIRGDEIPVDPDDIAVNTYYEDDKHLNFYPNDYTAMVLGVGWVNVCGVSNDEAVRNIAVVVSDADGETAVQEIGEKESENKYSIIAKLPRTLENSAEISVYTGRQRYGEYESIIHSYVYINEDENGNWSFAESPVYESNKVMYEKDKSVRSSLKSTKQITADNETVKALAAELAEGCGSDYEKLVSIHDWICRNVYYDKDILKVYNTPEAEDYPYLAADIINRKKAVCRGYAYTFAALSRAMGIPCNIVSGYALGIDGEDEWTDSALNAAEANHAWNEAYADGRWIIIDSTWDCKNKIEDGKAASGDINHVFFDANIRFFSQNHRIMEYIYE